MPLHKRQSSSIEPSASSTVADSSETSQQPDPTTSEAFTESFSSESESSTESSFSSSTSSTETESSTESSAEPSTSAETTSSEEPTTTSTSSTPISTVSEFIAESSESASSIPPPTLSTSTSFAPIPATTLIVPLPTATSTSQPLLPTTTSVTPEAAGAASSSFWDNGSAVAGTFAAVGLVSVGIFAALAITLFRKYRNRRVFRDTIIWSDKPADPDFRPGSPTVADMAQQSPMDPFGSRDPYYDNVPITHVPYRPYINERPREPSVYSQNMAGFGTALATRELADPHPPVQASTSAYLSAPPPPSSFGKNSPGHSHQASLDSFYAGYTVQNGPAGQAM